jgi:diguanylate cyclase
MEAGHESRRIRSAFHTSKSCGCIASTASALGLAETSLAPSFTNRPQSRIRVTANPWKRADNSKVRDEFTDVTLLAEVVATQHAISTSDFDLEAVMGEIVTQARRLTRADGAVVEMVEGDEMVYRAAAGSSEPYLGLRLKIGNSLSGFCVSSGEIVLCDDSETDPRVDRETTRKVGARSMVVVPLRHRDTVAGVLKVSSRQPGAFGERELRVLQMMADLLGSAIVRADLLGRLAVEATTDVVTGLPNRRAWEERLPLELARARRLQSAFTIAVIDLDRFKAYNDEHGHTAGDRLLADCARLWREQLREVDHIARIGGEEFGLALPACSGTEAVDVLARLRAATRPLRTISAGIAEWDPAEDWRELVARADAALYRAKRDGRDRVAVAIDVLARLIS